MSDRLVLSQPASHALAVLSRALLTAWRTCALYPATHPVVGGAVARVLEAVAEAAEAGVADRISITPKTLLVRGQAPAESLGHQDAGAVAELAGLLHARGIIEIGFSADVTPHAIARLLALLGRSTDAQQVVEAWKRDGDPGIHLEAIDYRSLLEDREARQEASDQDDIWLAIVSALRAGRRIFDEREQERLLALAGDIGQLAALAETITAEQCLPDGSALVTTQASTVLSCFRHLVSIASVIAPERRDEILRNLMAALLRLEPHVAVELVSLDRERRDDDPAIARLADALDEETASQLLARIVIDEGAAPRLARVFGLLVPDGPGRRHVLDRARVLAAGQYEPSARPFDTFWASIEELLGSYNDEPFVSPEYRAVLDSSGGCQPAARTQLPEMDEWLETLGEVALRRSSLVMLTDLVRLETATERAVIALNHLADLCDELLLSGAFGEALEVLRAIGEAASRDDLATAAAQALERTGRGVAVAQTVSTIGELDQADWTLLERCYLAIGASVLTALEPAMATEHQDIAAVRAGAVFVAMGEAAIAPLSALLGRVGNGARASIAMLLGEIGGPAVVPALQPLLRTHDSNVLRAALAALAAIDHPAAARALHLALRSDATDKREMVVNALVAVNDRRVVPMLARLLHDCRPLADDFDVTLHALDAFGRLKDPRAIASIRPIMTMRSWWSRRRLRTLKRACVRALACMADVSAVAALEEASRTGDRMLRSIIRSESPSQAGVA